MARQRLWEGLSGGHQASIASIAAAAAARVLAQHAALRLFEIGIAPAGLWRWRHPSPAPSGSTRHRA